MSRLHDDRSESHGGGCQPGSSIPFRIYVRSFDGEGSGQNALADVGASKDEGTSFRITLSSIFAY